MPLHTHSPGQPLARGSIFRVASLHLQLPPHLCSLPAAASSLTPPRIQVCQIWFYVVDNRSCTSHSELPHLTRLTACQPDNQRPLFSPTAQNSHFNSFSDVDLLQGLFWGFVTASSPSRHLSPLQKQSFYTSPVSSPTDLSIFHPSCVFSSLSPTALTSSSSNALSLSVPPFCPRASSPC